MTSRKNRILITATAIAAVAGPAAPAQAAPLPRPEAPSISAFYGDETTGPTDRDFSVPEYQDSQVGSTRVVFTVVNTGRVPVTLNDASGCGSDQIAPGGRVVCDRSLDTPNGAPDTTAPLVIDITATGGGRAAAARLTGTYRFSDVPPVGPVEVQASSTWVAAPGTRVDFQLDRFVAIPWTPEPQVVALTSTLAGDLLDPANTEAGDNTCATSGAHDTCSYSAVVTGTPGQTIEETVTEEVSDGTGPTVTTTSTVQITIGHDAEAWAAPTTEWPKLSLDHVAVNRRTWTTDVFDMPGRCERVVPARLGALLTTPVPEKGKCLQQWRLARAAAVAVLNEASLGDDYPADSPEAVQSETVDVLNWGNTRAASRLAERYESWNQG